MKGKNDRLLVSGAAVGGMVYLVLMIQAYLGISNFSYFGLSNQHVSDAIWRDYSGVVAGMLGRIAANHLVLGALIGICAARILALTGARFFLTCSQLVRSVVLIIAVLIVHCLFMAASMAHYPQLYVESFHNKGGILAFIQNAVCSSPLPFSSRELILSLLVFWLLLEIRRAIQLRFTVPGLKQLAFSTLLLCGFIIIFQQNSGGYSLSSKNKALPLHSKKRAETSPNLLIIAADSLRTDRIFSEGQPIYTIAPTMARLAREGTSFTRAYSVLPRTFPSWVSMLTGCYPGNHHIQHMFPTVADRSNLPPAVPQILAQEGYATAVIADFAGDMFSRIDLGFQHVQAPYFNFPILIRQRLLELDYHLLPYAANKIGRRLFPVLDEFAQNADPELLTDKVLETLPTLPEPWIVLVFYGTAHFPYAAPAPYYKMFTDPGYRGPFKYHKPHDLAEKSRTKADIRQVRSLYDGAVRSIDDQVGRLLRTLEKENNVLDRTVLMITADHGENLYDGDLGMGHGDHLFGEQSVHIPLIFWSRNGTVPAGRICRSVIPNIDLAPTLLDLAGLKKEDFPAMDGNSLKPRWTTETDKTRQSSGNTDLQSAADRPVLMETGIWFSNKSGTVRQQQRIAYPSITELAEIDRGTNHEVVLKKTYTSVVRFGKHRALYQGGRKLIYIPTTEGVHWFMFDPVSDPLNIDDLLLKEPETAERLKESLLTLLTEEDYARFDEYVVPRQALSQTPAPLPPPGWLDRLPSRDTMQP